MFNNNRIVTISNTKQFNQFNKNGQFENIEYHASWMNCKRRDVNEGGFLDLKCSMIIV